MELIWSFLSFIYKPIMVYSAVRLFFVALATVLPSVLKILVPNTYYLETNYSSDLDLYVTISYYKADSFLYVGFYSSEAEALEQRNPQIKTYKFWDRGDPTVFYIIEDTLYYDNISNYVYFFENSDKKILSTDMNGLDYKFLPMNLYKPGDYFVTGFQDKEFNKIHKDIDYVLYVKPFWDEQVELYSSDNVKKCRKKCQLKKIERP